MTVSEACSTGNLDWLRRKKAAGTLPKLLKRDTTGWYPHELATKNGHLDIIKWLVEESGQSIDVTADNNFAVRLAAARGHLAVVRWLVEESGQSVDITADDNYARRWAFSRGRHDIVEYLNVVSHLGLSNFRTVMRVLNGNLEAVKDVMSMISARLAMTEDDIRVLVQSIALSRRASARKI